MKPYNESYLMSSNGGLEAARLKINENLSFEALKERLFSPDAPIEKPETIIGIEENEGISVIGSPGNPIVISGPSKGGKSALVGAWLAGTMKVTGDVALDTLGFYIKANTEGLAVLHLDNELSDYDHYRFNQNVLKRSSRSTPPEWYYSFRLRGFSTSQMTEATKTILVTLNEKHKGIHLVVIDQCAEFVDSVNDEKATKEAVNLFLNLSEQYQTVFVLVLHYNPSSEKGRGHLGSELERKCESYLSIKKDGENSIVEPKLLRNAGNFDPVMFEYNHSMGYHTFLCQDTRKKESTEEHKELQQERKKTTWINCINEAFNGCASLNTTN